ncbi:hypothetical protein J1N35_023737 [Gossypium stocksii]|uniref:Leucine-rich repeat-containing N-terminal plant-type domain-containing protein n=1 Tax=Gossypium stocksii TaxID=47602 RepID=A0A9D4A2D3_9ROSI|nr:hypothetical protein J1N35_023737 [Gossypium stocksii]
MAKTIFLPFLLLALLVLFGASLSVNSLNITADQLNLLALKSYISHDPHNLLETNWSTSTSVCNWIGVTCGSRHHRVIALNLSNMDLTGTIPSQLGNLSFLACLDIHSNSFHGSLPIELTNLHRLKYLNLSNNCFDGELPSWFGYFPKLQSLSLSHNYFNGVVPSILALNLTQNRIFGKIPSSLFKCKELTYLSLYNNSLEGSIPREIENLTSLEYLYLGHNNLKGKQFLIIKLSTSHLDIALTNSFDFGTSSQLSAALDTLFPTVARHKASSPSSSFILMLKAFVMAIVLSFKAISWSREHHSSLSSSSSENSTSLAHFPYWNPNFLSGRIPTPPPSLLWYFVSRNKLVGDIPSSICNASSLKVLTLWNNSLHGTVPECIGNLSSSLSHIDLQNNNFHGKIPESFAKHCSLQSFRINNNQIGGSLPRSLGNCKNLNLLDVGNNNLNDTFPNWLGNLDHLQVLVLRSNKFFGQMDNSDVTVSFTRLRVIDLSRNNFSGYLPTNFFKNLHSIRKGHEKKLEPEYMEDASDFVILDYAYGLSFTVKGSEREFQSLFIGWMIIDFSENQFFGELPKTLGELHSLIVLNLSHNCLTGPIPSSLGDMSELQSLDLSSNKFQGRIPTELTNLGFLAVLNLSQNNLKGPIPQGKQFDTFTNDSYKENLGLCGLPLSKRCDNDGGTLLKFDRDDEELNWKFSILMGCGCGLVLGLSMGYIVFTTRKPCWLIKIVKRVQRRFAKR